MHAWPMPLPNLLYGSLEGTRASPPTLTVFTPAHNPLSSPPPDSPIMWWPSVADSTSPGGTLGVLVVATIIAGMCVDRWCLEVGLAHGLRQ